MTKVKVRPLKDLDRLRVLRKAELVLVLLVGALMPQVRGEVFEHDRGVNMYFPVGGKMVIL